MLPVSLIVYWLPFKEAIDRFTPLQKEKKLPIELLILTEEKSCDLEKENIHLIPYKKGSDISRAIIQAISLATNETIVVINGSLYPNNKSVIALLEAMTQGADIAVGTRHHPLSKIEGTSFFLGTLERGFKQLAAKLLTPVKDPLSELFAFKKSHLLTLGSLHPVGRQTCLEVLTKSPSKKISEVPIVICYDNLQKLPPTLERQIKYIKHIRRLYLFKRKELTYLIQFLTVGTIGTIINLGVLTLLLRLGMEANIAIAIGLFVGLCCNFFLNRRFTFVHAIKGSLIKQFLVFLSSSSIGSLVGYLISISLLSLFEGLPPQGAVLISIPAGTVINYFLNRYLVFRG